MTYQLNPYLSFRSEAAGPSLMLADTPEGMEVGSNGAVALSGGPDAHDDLTAAFAGLSAGGTDVLPLGRAPWGDWFGSCTDRFGIRWMVNIAGH